METKCKSNDTQSQSVIPKNFAKELRLELYESSAHSTNPSTGGSVEHVVVAEFQSDSYMADQILNKKTVMVQTKDSDILIIYRDDYIEIQ